MRKTITASALAAAMILGGAGVAAATTSGSGPNSPGSNGSATVPPSPGPSSAGSHSQWNSPEESSSRTPMRTGVPPQASGAPTGKSTNHPINSDAELRQDLQAKGFSSITNIVRKGNSYTADAKLGSMTVKLWVDASSGQVTRQEG